MFPSLKLCSTMVYCHPSEKTDHTNEASYLPSVPSIRCSAMLDPKNFSVTAAYPMGLGREKHVVNRGSTRRGEARRRWEYNAEISSLSSLA